ncbi:MAG: site-2 protease family protein [Planctomycetota bacterium]|nr:MAG: site-2 protease family protein [Planctomycetota bacterium]
MDWWVANLMRDNPALLASWVVWVVGSIVLHELGHGWAAIARGDRTPIERGHMTWNPMVHMGPMSLLVFAIVGIAWGAMPVDPSRMRGRYADAAVSAAGPAMNLGLAMVAVVLAALWRAYAGGVGEPLYTNVAMFFEVGAFLNLLLMALNLLPIPPLDGSRILADFSPGYRRLIDKPEAAMVGMLLLIVVLFGGFDRVAGPMRDLRDRAVWGLVDRLPGAGTGLTAEEQRALEELGLRLDDFPGADGAEPTPEEIEAWIRRLEERVEGSLNEETPDGRNPGP